MASATVPTVPFPTPIDDTDDDDDDDVPPPAAPVPATSAPAAAPTPAPPAANPTVPGQPAASSAIPGVPSGSANPNASGLGPSGSARVSSGLPTSTGVAGQSGSGNGGGGGGLSTGAQAGIGVGVVLAVLLLAVGAWAFIRRRRRRQQLNRKTSESTYNGGSPDVETARNVPAPGPEVRAYYAGASELGSGRDGEKYYNELASPVNPQEVHGDREFAAELPGSAVPVRGDKQGEMWSPGPPTYEQTHAPQPEKKSGVRLFDDAPIDARDEPVDYDDRPAMADRKGKM